MSLDMGGCQGLATLVVDPGVDAATMPQLRLSP